jgi:hypothetical protein
LDTRRKKNMFAKYSNGWGHLVMSLAVIAMVTVLLMSKTIDVAAAVGIVAPVITFWFMSGTVNRFNAPIQPSGTASNSPLPPITAPSPSATTSASPQTATSPSAHGG